jgi:hypothetical protein
MKRVDADQDNFIANRLRTLRGYISLNPLALRVRVSLWQMDIDDEDKQNDAPGLD